MIKSKSGPTHPRRYWLLLGHFLFVLAISSTASAANIFETLKQLKADCGVDLGTEVRNPFRHELIKALENYLKETTQAREDMTNRLENLLAEEKNNLSDSPQIARKTMMALIDAYGDNQTKTYPERMAAFQKAASMLPEDPYFIWLRSKSETDPVEFFKQAVHVGGSANLGLSLALLRLRASLDPNFPTLSRALVAVILTLKAREYLVADHLRTLKHGDDGGAWTHAGSLIEAKSAQARIFKSIRANSQGGLSIADYEKLKAFLNVDNPDTETLRRHVMAVDGLYKDKLPADEVKFLAEEAERLRREMGLSEKVAFNAQFLMMWPTIWGQAKPYDIVLLRHFYQPEADRARVETELNSLNLYIELAEAAASKHTLNDFYNALFERHKHRFSLLD